ncbi:hypothetical protein [Hyella patelloides]|uniref:hypothetical protein n=1 Tax=Hyella patelloides TaxID=1982969 RepID=UPI0011A6226C|nr:hypothetical protein [Hyella patelloides]
MTSILGYSQWSYWCVSTMLATEFCLRGIILHFGYFGDRHFPKISNYAIALYNSGCLDIWMLGFKNAIVC